MIAYCWLGSYEISMKFSSGYTFYQTNSIYKFRLYIGGYFVQAPMRLSLNEGLSDIR